MKLSAKQRRRYLLLPIPAVAAVAIGAVFASSAMAEAAALEWTLTKTPDLGEKYSLSDVHAIAENDVWAVGETYHPDKAVALHWNGKEWEDSKAPEGSSLSDVSSVGEDVWAVGAADDKSTLTARWDGKAWEAVPSPQLELPDDSRPRLGSVHGVAADDVWAVGGSTGPMYPEGTTPILQHWDGTEWSFMDVPLPEGAVDAGLSAVRARAADDVWALGATFDAKEVMSPLLLHWNGKEWSTRDLPIAEALPQDIAFTEDGRIWLSGTVLPGSTPFDGKPLMVVGDGKTWNQLEVPAEKQSLPSITPDGTGGVVAVGGDGDKVMVVRSDGETVTREAAPAVEAEFSYLEGVSVVPGTETLWTVGFLDKFAAPVAAHTT